MPSPVQIRLTLSVAACVRSESVLFRITITNTANQVVPDAPTLDPRLEPPAIRLIAKPVGAGEARRGSARTAIEREGQHPHGPEGGGRAPLAPGQRLEQQGDVIQWLGELPPGRYDLTAECDLTAETIASEPAPLTVNPIHPVAVLSSRPALPMFDAPLVGAWLNGGEKPGGPRQVFYQHRSRMNPAAPQLCVVVGATVSEGEEPHPALLDTAAPPLGHVVWLQRRSIRVAGVDLRQARPAGVSEVGAPFAGRILPSPLSAGDGSVFVAMTGGDRAGVVHIGADGREAHPAVVATLPTGEAGPASCGWEHDQRLNLVAAALRGRQVALARFDLTDPKAAPVVTTPIAADEPIIWLHCEPDEVTALAERPAFEHNTSPPARARNEPVVPRVWVWTLGVRADRCIFTKFDGATGARMETRSLAGGEGMNPEQLRPIASAHVPRSHPVVLLADDAGRLWVASGAAARVVRVEEAIGTAVSLDDSPVLMAAGDQGVLPWVVLRRLNKERTRVEDLLLEPGGEKLPEDHEH